MANVTIFLLGVFVYALCPWGTGRGDHSEQAEKPEVTFLDVTREAGIDFKHENAASQEKYLLGTMGSGCAFLDYDQDGFLDIFFVNGGVTPACHPPRAITNSLYRSEGNGRFTEVTANAGVGQNPRYGMGVAVGDFDNDGWKNLIIVNGHVMDNVNLYQKEVFHAERKMAYWNCRGRFLNVSNLLGAAFQQLCVGRGLAIGDYDNDGALDLLVSNNGQAGELLHNSPGNQNHWSGIRLLGTTSNRDGAGARLKLTSGGGADSA